MSRSLPRLPLLMAASIAPIGHAMAGPAEECEAQAAEAFSRMQVVAEQDVRVGVTRDFVGLYSARRSSCVLLLRVRHVDLRAGWPRGQSLGRVGLKLSDLSSAEVLGEFRKWDERYSPELCQGGDEDCRTESDWLLKVLQQL